VVSSLRNRLDDAGSDSFDSERYKALLEKHFRKGVKNAGFVEDNGVKYN
jgi:hypothetical protein